MQKTFEVLIYPYNQSLGGYVKVSILGVVYKVYHWFLGIPGQIRAECPASRIHQKNNRLLSIIIDFSFCLISKQRLLRFDCR